MSNRQQKAQRRMAIILSQWKPRGDCRTSQQSWYLYTSDSCKYNQNDTEAHSCKTNIYKSEIDKNL